MANTKILFVSSEITPYLEETHLSKISRYLPQGIQEKGNEIRTFMPRYGCINERKNLLHEVIRLSGQNIIINDNDHPLIIKVASIQVARMQIYFIDNDDFFKRKTLFCDEQNKFFKDNDERAIFFAKGVIETVKNLGWSPDIIHCHGWFSGLVPLFIKRYYQDSPFFSNSKVVYSVYNDGFKHKFNAKFTHKLVSTGIPQADVEILKTNDYGGISKSAVAYSDAVILGDETIDASLADFIKQSGKPVLAYQNSDSYIEAYADFYDQILNL